MFIIWVEKKDVQININSTLTLYKNQFNTIFSRSIGSWLGSLFWIETLQFIFMLLLMSCWRWTGCRVVREKHWSVIGMFCKQTFTWCSTVKKVTVVLSLQNKNRNIHSKAFSKYSYYNMNSLNFNWSKILVCLSSCINLKRFSSVSTKSTTVKHF